jgi:hypothetical protein
MVEVFIKVSGYSDGNDDKRINPGHIVEVHFNSREQRYDIAMSSARYIEVLEPEAITAIDLIVGRDVPDLTEADETYI